MDDLFVQNLRLDVEIKKVKLQLLRHQLEALRKSMCEPLSPYILHLLDCLDMVVLHLAPADLLVLPPPP